MYRRFLLLFFMFWMVHQLGYGTVFYIDSINGNSSGDGSETNPWQSFNELFTANMIESHAYVTPYDPNNPQLIIKNAGAIIKEGDTIKLNDGFYGDLHIQNYINSEFITVIANENSTPIFKSLLLQGAKKWRFVGIHVSSESYDEYIANKLVHLQSHSWQGKVSNIEIKNCKIYSTETPWINATDWNTKASDGIFIKGDSISIINNELKNIRFGITLRGNHIIAKNNSIVNFSGDGMRILGSFNLVEGNTIKNCYDVDENHDDGIQSYTTGGLAVNSNIVRKNIILNYEDPNQPLLGPLQGIGCFDGPFDNWIVENNLIVVNHWHGISFYGAHGCKIINNTVVDPTPNESPGPTWIKIADLNTIIATGNLVKNNIANSISVTENTTNLYNGIVENLADYQVNFVDYQIADFHLNENSIFIDSGNSLDAPLDDLEGNTRPYGNEIDLGAFEYQEDVLGTPLDEIFVASNPFTNSIKIMGNSTVTLSFYDVLQKKIKELNNVSLPLQIELPTLPPGTYYLDISEIDSFKKRVIKIIKL